MQKNPDAIQPYEMALEVHDRKILGQNTPHILLPAMDKVVKNLTKYYMLFGEFKRAIRTLD